MPKGFRSCPDCCEHVPLRTKVYTLGVSTLCADGLVDQEAVLVRRVMGWEGREKDLLEPWLRGGLGWERRVAGRRAPWLRRGLGCEGRVAGQRAQVKELDLSGRGHLFD